MTELQLLGLTLVWGPCKVPEEEFVDQKRLKEIADLTGGIASFSADPQDIAKALKEFLNAVQGQYELGLR